MVGEAASREGAASKQGRRGGGGGSWGGDTELESPGPRNEMLLREP